MRHSILFCPACGERCSSETMPPGYLDGDDDSASFTCPSCHQRAPVVDCLPSVLPHVVAEERPLTELSDAARPRVVVGHELPATAHVVAATLRRAGYAPVSVRSGDELVVACDPIMPASVAAVVLDVAIPAMLAFEAIDELRREPATARIPIILLAAVFERTRHRRRPGRLYGADACIEGHSVETELVPALASLLASSTTTSPTSPTSRSGAPSVAPLLRASDPDTILRFARALITDVAIAEHRALQATFAQTARGGVGSAPFDRARERFVAGVGEAHLAAFEDELRAYLTRVTTRGPRRGGGDG